MFLLWKSSAGCKTWLFWKQLGNEQDGGTEKFWNASPASQQGHVSAREINRRSSLWQTGGREGGREGGGGASPNGEIIENNRVAPSLLVTELPLYSVSKRALVYWTFHMDMNEFYLHVHCLANQTHFHMKGCAPGLVLKQRQKAIFNNYPLLLKAAISGGYLFNIHHFSPTLRWIIVLVFTTQVNSQMLVIA